MTSLTEIGKDHVYIEEMELGKPSRVYRVLVTPGSKYLKVIIPDREYRLDSARLSREVAEDYNPDFVIGVYRGGIIVQNNITGILEHLREAGRKGPENNDIAFRDHSATDAFSYTGVGQSGLLTIRALDHVLPVANGSETDRTGSKRKSQRLLLVDDILEKGVTLHDVRERLKSMLDGSVEIKLAAPYVKPYARIRPVKLDFPATEFGLIDYRGEKKEPWLVFPDHNIYESFSPEELKLYDPALYEILHGERKPLHPETALKS